MQDLNREIVLTARCRSAFLPFVVGMITEAEQRLVQKIPLKKGIEPRWSISKTGADNHISVQFTVDEGGGRQPLDALEFMVSDINGLPRTYYKKKPCNSDQMDVLITEFLAPYRPA